MKRILTTALLLIGLLFVLYCQTTNNNSLTKPIIAYVTDDSIGLVEFTDGGFICLGNNEGFAFYVEDSLFSYNSLNSDGAGVFIYAIAEVNSEDTIVESFAIKLHCGTYNGYQLYTAPTTSKSLSIVKWLTTGRGYVQFTIPGGRSTWLTVLVPCNEHFLGY